MSTHPAYLVTPGKIGRRLVSRLLSLPSKPRVVVPTSNAAKLEASLPGDFDKTRLFIVEGNIKDPHFVETTLKEYDVTGVSMALTGDDELFTTTKFLDAIQRSGTVKHIVYISACEDYSIEAILNESLQGQSAALILVKYIIEAKLRWSRVDVEDIALAAANSLADDGRVWAGKKVMIGSLKTYTSHETAQMWSKALGKDIKPSLSDQAGLDGLEDGFGKVAGPAWGRDLRLMYETFAQRGFLMNETDYNDQLDLLKKEPESYEDFVHSVAKQWVNS